METTRVDRETIGYILGLYWCDMGVMKKQWKLIFRV